MFDQLSLFALLPLFAACAAVIWFAGVKLADTTDILSKRFGLGEALGGIIVLAVATNLPEIAITASAAWTGKLDVAVANILGGIAIQTVVLAALDAARPGRRPLTNAAASLSLVVEALLVVAVLVVAIMGTQLPKDLVFFHVSTGALAVLLVWLGGIWLVKKADKGLPWQASKDTDGGSDADKPKGHSQGTKSDGQGGKKQSTAHVAIVFVAAAVATLVAGVLLEQSGDAVAKQIGMTGALFAATVLAAATSLPELSTGITSVLMGDTKLAISDIFGGNAFLPTLFLLAVLVSGQASLPQAKASDIYLAGLGILLTCVYAAGLLFRPQSRRLRMGVDSRAVIVLYAVGVAGLAVIPGGN